MDPTTGRNLDKAALCGEPSYVWRDGQERRLKMILQGLGDCVGGRMLENGCGIGMYVGHLAPYVSEVVGLEFDLERAVEAGALVASTHDLPGQKVDLASAHIVCGAGEKLPFPGRSYMAILSHEVLEHVQDDRQAVCEMVRVLEENGRIALFVPNRGYPFETHGFYWRGQYRFGNIPLINWLPRSWRDQLAPHVRVYSQHDLKTLFRDLPVRIISRTIVFGAYDNIIQRWPGPGRWLRLVLQFLEKTPLRFFGLSHFWVIEKYKSHP